MISKRTKSLRRRKIEALEARVLLAGDTFEVVDSSLNGNSELVEIRFSEALDPATLDIDDLRTSEGTVLSAEAVDETTARYTVSGLTPKTVLTISIDSGALTDTFGNNVSPYTTTYPQRKPNTPIKRGGSPLPGEERGDPLTFQPLAPAGSMAYESVEMVGKFDVEEFSLDLESGQVISIALNGPESSAPSSNMPLVRLQAPDGSIVAKMSTTTAGTQRLNAKAEATGSYIVLVDNSFGSMGVYPLRVAINASHEMESVTAEGTNESLESAELLEFHTHEGVTIANKVATSSSNPIVIYETDLSQNPRSGEAAWSLNRCVGSCDDGDAWSWGRPIGAEGGPEKAFTGDKVIGFDLRGAYGELPDGVWAQMPVLNTQGMQFVELSFQRWLSMDAEDLATITVSTDGNNWTEVYSNHGFETQDTTWVEQSVDLSDFAGQAEVRVRFNMGPTVRRNSRGIQNRESLGGWSLDDILVTGVAASDIYEMKLSKQQVVSIATAPQTNHDRIAELTLIAGDGTAIATGRSDAAGGFSINDWVVPTDGNYFVQVKALGRYGLTATRGTSFGHSSSLEPQPQNISLTSKVLSSVTPGRNSTPTETEPNDDGEIGVTQFDLALANDLTNSFLPVDDRSFEVSVTGEITEGGDQDWDFYQFKAAPGDVLKIELLGSHRGHGTLFDPYLHLFDRNGNLLEVADNFHWRDAYMEVDDFPYEGEYYVAADSYGDEKGTYELQIAMYTDRNLLTRSNPKYQFGAAAGDSISLTVTSLACPWEAACDLLDPVVNVVGPDGEQITFNELSGNHSHRFVAALDGNYEVVVSGQDDSLGDYLLTVSGSTGASPSFAVTTTDLQHIDAFPAVPQSVEVQFNQDVLVSSLSADDLIVGEQRATDVQLVDATTARFTLPQLVEGENLVGISAQAIKNLRGEELLPFSTTIKVDTVPPIVVSGSIESQAVVIAEEPELELQFSEPLQIDQFHREDVVLRGEFGELSPRSFSWNETNDALTLGFGELPDDSYELVLPNETLVDLAGNKLDGAGDGRAGVDYRLEFVADETEAQVLVPNRRGDSLVQTASMVGHAGPGDEGDRYLIELDTNQLFAIELEASGRSNDVEAVLSGPGIENPVQINSNERSRLHAFRAIESGTYVLDIVQVDDVATGYAADIFFDAQLEDESTDFQTLASGRRTLESNVHYSVIGEIGRRDLDVFEITLEPGQAISIAVEADGPGLSLELLRDQEPVAVGGQTPNFSAVVSNFVSEGTVSQQYTITVAGESGTKYQLTAVEGGVFEIGHNSKNDAQRLDDSAFVLGSLFASRPVEMQLAWSASAAEENTTPTEFASSLTPATPSNSAAADLKHVVPGRLIVGAADGVNQAQLRAQAEELGATVISSFDFIDAIEVDLGAATDVVAAAAAWSNYGWVEYAEYDTYSQVAQYIPNDPNLGELYGLQNPGRNMADRDIDATEAWKWNTGSESVVVAVVDSGIDYLHEDLAANMWVNPGEIPGDGIDNDGNGYVDDIHGIDTGDRDSDPMDVVGHGTHVAGILGAVGNNGTGVAGVNWDVQIMAIKAWADGVSSLTGADVITAYEYMVTMKQDYGVNIVVGNHSYGRYRYNRSQRDAIEAMTQVGILYVASAMNDSNDNDEVPTYRASYDIDGIISVAATDENDELASFSNYGLTSVDLGAPGVDIVSTISGNSARRSKCNVYDNKYCRFSGTSMAAPYVTGAVALLAAEFPDATMMDLKQAILDGVDPVESLQGKTVTGGRLNVANSMRILGDRGDYYQFRATAGVEVTLAARAWPAGGANVDLEITAPDGTLVAHENSNGNELVKFRTADTGEYVVRVFSTRGPAHYTLAVEQNEWIPGDANRDGKVSFSDFLVLSQNFGKVADAVWADGDFDSDQGVSFADFLILSQNFGRAI